MPIQTTLAPQRDFDNHDVINQFKWNPTGAYPTNKGTIVKILSGLMTDQTVQMLGSVGASYANTVSQRYGVQPSVAAVTSSGDQVLGMLLDDIREVDENGEKLIFKREKAAMMQVSMSGEPVRVVTRGWFVYSGVSGTAIAGEPAYASVDGNIMAVPAGATVTATRVGTFLGPKDSRGFVYLKLAL